MSWEGLLLLLFFHAVGCTASSYIEQCFLEVALLAVSNMSSSNDSIYNSNGSVTICLLWLARHVTMSNSDSDTDVNELDNDIFSGPPPMLPHRRMRIRLIWTLNFYTDPLTSMMIANLCSDDVQQAVAAYHRVLRLCA